MIAPRILLIDNDPHFRESLAQDVLEPEGYEVTQATNLDTALELAEKDLFHLAIVDIRLGDDDNPNDRSGIDLCQQLDPTIPRLILTGYPEWDAVRQVLQPQGNGERMADGFLFKTEGPPTILQEIERVLQTEFEIIPQQRIAVLTSGADSPGMNSAIRAIVRTACDHGIEVLGVQDGFRGLVNDQMRKLTWHDVSGIAVQSGTLLDSTRFPAFEDKLVRKDVIRNLQRKNISGLVVIGGEGSMRGANALTHDIERDKKNIQIIGIPGTIDNDVWGTDMSLGTSSVSSAMIQDLRHLFRPDQNLRSVYIIEAPGRFSGYLTLQAALGIGANAAILPEQVVEVYPATNESNANHWHERVDIDKTTSNFRALLEKIVAQLEPRFLSGSQHGLIILNEGIGQLTGNLLTAAYVQRYLEENIREWPTHIRPRVRTHVLAFPCAAFHRIDLIFGLVRVWAKQRSIRSSQVLQALWLGGETIRALSKDRLMRLIKRVTIHRKR